MRTWATVKDVKDILQQHLHIPPSAQHLYFGPLMTSGGELPNHRTLNDAGIYRSGETLLLDIQGVSSTGLTTESSSISSLRSNAASDVCVSSSMLDSTPRQLRRVVQQARRGFALGLKPELVLDGSGGTYFLHDARKVKVAVFKPADEEPYAENNPRGYVNVGDDVGDLCDGLSMRAGIKPGEACVREVAAFLLDHGGFSGVPMTTLAEARHPAFNTNGAMLTLAEGGAAVGSHSLSSLSPSSPRHFEKKVGSCQDYVSAECSMDDLSPSKLSVDEVHKIAILDIRIMNADRNSANLLCRRRPKDNTFELIPIDHGYCLRSVCDVSWFDWCWLDWPQLKQPLSQESKEFVLNLDIEADVRLLQERLNIGSDAIDYFRASSKLLQAGVKAGLRLYDIAIMCCRNDDAGEVPSKLESLVSMSTELATSAVENGRWHHAAASRALAEQLTPEVSSLTANGHASGHNKTSSSPFIKSASSANFSSFMSDDSGVLESAGQTVPPMTQSSASDTSSDVEDVVSERGECEEWAAHIVADVSMDNCASMMMQRSRSHSVGSNSSTVSEDSDLSSSHVGFWYVKPGSSTPDDVNDDGALWSPEASPRQSISIPVPSFSTGVVPTGDKIVPRRPSVTFEVPATELPPPPPPPAVDVPAINMSISHEEDASPKYSPHLRKAGGLVRSQSYSAFSAKSVTDSPLFSLVNIRAGSSTTAESDLFRVYFFKFIDLLIVRETAASRPRKSSTESPFAKDAFRKKTESGTALSA